MKRAWCMVAVLFSICVATFAEPAQISKNDKLRLKPFIDAKIVLALAKGQKVDIQKRQGSWYFIAVGKTTGWAPMLSVHRTTPAATATKGSASTVATGRSSTGAVVATTGVRGLNEDSLNTAAFSEEAVAAVEKNRVAAADAAAFAAAGAMQPKSVPSLVMSKSKGGKK